MNRFLIVILFIAYLNSNSQILTEKTLQQRNTELYDEYIKYYEDNKKDFSVKSVHDSLKDESYVVLALSIKDIYISKVVDCRNKVFYRARVLLLDDAAVSDYSKLIAPATPSIQIIVEKEDGTRYIYRGNDGVDAPEYKEDNSDVEYKKFSIPNLTKGDIVDYSYLHYASFSNADKVYYTSVSEPIHKEYVVLFYEHEFHLFENAYMYFKSFNVGNRIKKVKKFNEAVYRFEMRNMSKFVPEQFTYKQISYPYYKYRVFTTGGESIVDTNIVESRIENELKSIKIYKSYWGRYHAPKGVPKFVSSFYNYNTGSNTTPGNVFKKLSNLEKAKYLYYYRTDFKYATFYDFRSGRYQLFCGLGNEYSKDFIKWYHALLKKYEVEFDYVIVPRRNRVSSLSEIMYNNDYRLIYRFKDGDSYVYFGENSLFSPPSMEWECEGIQGKLVKDIYVDELEYEDYTIPFSKANDNTLSETQNISLNFKEKNVSVKRKISAKGYCVENYQVNIITRSDYFKDVLRYWKPKNKRPNMSKKQLAKLNEFDEDKRTKYLKEGLEHSFKISNYEFDSLVQNGKYEKELIFYDNYIIDDLISKAGRGYIIKVGELIGGQVKITEEERNRKSMININYAKMYIDSIVIEIPKGYNCSGIEKLNTEVDNECGSFTTSAVVKDSKVIIKTMKKYKKAQDIKENWNSWLEFLDAANSYSNSRLLLNKD